MSKIKIELFKSKTLSDGRNPICIKVSNNGTQARKSISSAFVKEFDDKAQRVKKSRPDFMNINKEIEKEFRKYYDRLQDIAEENPAFAPAEVFKNVPVKSKYLLENYKIYLDYIKTKSEFTYLGYVSDYNKLKDFLGNSDIQIREIDLIWIDRYKAYLSGLNNGNNTIMGALKLLIRINRRAKAQNEDIESIKIKFTKTYKEKLTPGEIQEFMRVEPRKGTNEYFSKQAFLLQYYFRGMRIGDLLMIKKDRILNGRLLHKSSKTEYQNSIAIPQAAMPIIEELSQRPGEYLLPFIKPDNIKDKETEAEEIKARTSIVNRNLKKIAKKANITKNVTTHIARHSFALNSFKALDYDAKGVQSLLGHGSLNMTEIYLRELQQAEILDFAASKLFT